MLASSLAFIDGSVTNVALPAISADLGGGAEGLSWIINAYLLPLSALILLGGAAGDQFGRKRTLLAGVFLFTLASVGCALSSDLSVLLAARVAQGIGAAILLPNSLGILGSSFEGEERGRAVGTWAAAGAISSAIGPPLGGWLVGTIGWRAIFYLNVPVAIAAIFIVAGFVRESELGKSKLDWIGAALATCALGSLTWALTLWSARHLISLEVGLGLGTGTGLLLAFFLLEHRLGERAMMPLSLFASRSFVGLTILTFLLYGALGGLLLLLPLLLINGGGYSPLQAGLALLPFSLVIGIASRFAGRLTERIGPRLPLTVGPIVTGFGFALLMFADPRGSYTLTILPGVTVIALGMAGAVAPLTTAVLSSVDGQHTGTASGFNSAIARTGGLIATALAGAILADAGDLLTSGFHAAAIICAMTAVAAGATAFVMVPARAETSG